MHSTDVGKHLYELVEKGMLLVTPNGRWTTYQLNGQYNIPPDQLQLSEITEPTLDLIDTDRIIYDYICENGFITSKQVISITKITTVPGASIALNRLINKKLIEKKRKGRQFYYVKAN